VLSTTAPLLRGDDVAELQERLAALGFDPGRVDGIYGALTRSAVASFQRDAGLGADGVAGPATVVELRRLAVRHPRTTLVNEVKERSVLARGPRGLETTTVAIGQSGGLDAVVAAAARELRARGAAVRVLDAGDEAQLVVAANESGARTLVVIRIDPGATAATAVYFASERSESPRGHRLADTLSVAAGRALGMPAATRAMTVPLVRETTMPASVLEVGPLERLVERTGHLAEAVATALESWATPSA